MKKKVISTQKLLFWTMLIMILPMLGACQKDDGMDQEGVINLKDIPENPIFADLPLVGTTWKLIGFGDERSGKVKLAEPKDCENCYKINFLENGEIWGRSHVNQTKGSFLLEENNNYNFKQFSFGRMSYAGELLDGDRFIDAMKEANRYDVTSRGLFLYYSSREYLLFQPSME